MKKLNYLFLSVITLTFLTLASCGDDDPGVPPIELVKERLAGTWEVDPNDATSHVSFKGEDRTDFYTTFALTLTPNAKDNPGGSYSTTLVEDPDPWPSNGTWVFTNPDNITTADITNFFITRNDGVLIDVTLTDTKLELVFTYDEAIHDSDNNRVMEVDGEWIFVLVPQN